MDGGFFHSGSLAVGRKAHLMSRGKRRGHPSSPRSFRKVVSMCAIFAFLCLLLPFISIFQLTARLAVITSCETIPCEDSFLTARSEINTKKLYDEIAFDDSEGGVWRQGWQVTYNGSEWDKEKLKVLVVPHSHNDPGWLNTVEEYYNMQTRHILNTIIESLKMDKRRKFIWEEISYLERWWTDASEKDKADLRHLILSGQLEIVGGGWVMNDEANAHYFAIIEQMTLGNAWLRDNVGVSPKNAWAIDPFGHSPTMAYLLRRMGFENMLIQRTHYEVKKALAKEKSLEFIWRQSWDALNSTDIFCHMMPFFSYDVPHTCGPDPSICCQFDFDRMPSVGSITCPWHKQPKWITPENVQERAETLLDQYRKKSTLYRTNTLLVPLGDDFRYTTVNEAEAQYTNYQRLFDYINSNPMLKAEVKFGTLEDYFTTLRDEVSRLHDGPDSPGDLEKSVDSQSGSVFAFPSLSGDFFTYADRQKDYWSGYYVTRPFYKAMDRILEETLRGADILYALAHVHCTTVSRSTRSRFPGYFEDRLSTARKNLALFQHHDGVTGTAKDHVVIDYAQRMHGSLKDLQEFMAESIRVLLWSSSQNGECQDADSINIFVPEQTRAGYDKQAIKYSVGLTGGHFRRVVLFNPLEQVVEQVVTILVEQHAVCVFNSNWESISSQINPHWNLESKADGGLLTGKHRLQWNAVIPGFGLQTYFISLSVDSSPCTTSKPASVYIYNAPPFFSCPPPYSCVHDDHDTIYIANQHLTAAFDHRHGLLQRLTLRLGADSEEITVPLEEEMAFYRSQGSGAYLFKPTGDASSFVEPGGVVMVTKGHYMQEVVSKLKSRVGNIPVVRSARLYAGASVQAHVAEMEYHTMLTESSYNNKELIARFKTNLNNGKVFYSDLNGFQTIRRETYDKIPLQGNFYPMPSLAFIQCRSGTRFSIQSRQSLGVAALGNGWLEVMLDRRLSQDDGRGLGQGVLDNHPNTVRFHLLLETNISKLSASDALSFHKLPSLLSHLVSNQLNYPTHCFIGVSEPLLQMQRSHNLNTLYSPIPATQLIPFDLHVLAMKILDANASAVSSTYGSNVALLFHRKGWDPAYGCSEELHMSKKHTNCNTVASLPGGSLNLRAMFDKQYQISNIRLSSLNLIHDGPATSNVVVASEQQMHRKHISWGEGSPFLVTIDAMEVQGYKFDMQVISI